MPSTNPRYRSWKKRDWARRVILHTREPICALCGKPVDLSLDWYVDPRDGKRKRHPLSAEIDEVVPVSRGGSPTDLDNLQIAHRICNQKRGNKTMGELKKYQGGLAIPRSQEW